MSADVGPLSAAQRQVNRRARLRDQRVPRNPVSNAERQRRYRERHRSRSQVAASFGATSRDGTMRDHWISASNRFETVFKRNTFGHDCGVCDRLWFERDLAKVKDRHLAILEPIFGNRARAFKVCGNCLQTLNKNKLPTLCTSNGFTYPPKPPGLPTLNPISTRLISPRIPFMSIRRLRRDGQYGIIGQVINVPIDVDSTVNQLPRQLDDDYVFNVSLKRKLIHRSSYLSGFVKKRDLKTWLEFLIGQPLYVHFGISINWPSLETESNRSYEEESGLVEDIQANARDIETLAARQQTVLWNEDNILDIAPGQRNRPLNLIFDPYAEELSFPQIYFGVGRNFRPNLSITPHMIANSEIRRSDRRGVTPEHILYMTMKILRLRVVDGIFNSFRCVRATENISRRMLEDKRYLEECIERNLSFLKSIPNSAQYWLSRRKDLFAMMRQLGKPTAFLTLSANEVRWPDLLLLLHKLNDYYKEVNVVDPMNDLDKSMRSHLVNEDPVTCCLYFHKLVDTIMNMLQSKRNYNPFGKYRVIDHFLRIEFQHRGSPHAHILLWLENDPKEKVSENMPTTAQLVTDLCSVSEQDIPEGMYVNQVHKHTFTCTKRGETSCRFNIPYWPMRETCVLMPLASEDGRRNGLRQKLKKVKENLSAKVYDSIDSFLMDNNLNDTSYLNMIRSSLSRPTLHFKRNMSEIMTNTFNPWIASVLNSNMDLQFILDEYSCASYVVDYINKSDRGTGNLHRELVKLTETHPEMTYDQLLKKLGSRILNTVELSAQEAAWLLLRQPMSKCSRAVVYIPTCWPCERQKSYKKRSQLDRENIELDSTDIWTKSIFDKYEQRPARLRNLCLADFAAKHTNRGSSNHETSQDIDVNLDVPLENTPSTYYSRQTARIIRYRNYDPSDIINFKRELVTLYLPFDCEHVDIIDRNRFISLYAENLDRITSKMREYNSGCDIEQFARELSELCNVPEDIQTIESVETRSRLVRNELESDEENFDNSGLNTDSSETVSAIRRRAGIMEKEAYCAMMRTTNERQRELILEVIHRLCLRSEQMKIFFTGPAGCGKTYVLKLIMETINRYSQDQNNRNNAYVACASTGKAAVNLGGTTVHSAFHLSQFNSASSVGAETVQRLKHEFANVQYVIIDEISMVGSDILRKVDQRLRKITGNPDSDFGGMNMIFCGDFRQLPPVNATPVYKGRGGHLEAATMWQGLEYYPLTQVMRQSDVAFSSILTKIGDGTALLEHEIRLIHSRFKTETWCDENLKDVVRLFHQNHRVDDYNKRIIQGGFELVAKDSYQGYSTNDQLVSARGKLHRKSTMETGGLPYCLKLAIGYPYMLNSNIDIDDGLVNGNIGTLRFIEDNVTEGEVQEGSRVWFEFRPESVGSKARTKVRSVVASSRGAIHQNWTPISTRSAGINLGGTVRCKRLQFPLSAACAMTIHKSQGGTFDRVVVEYEEPQQTQLVYVALSRVSSIEGLYLTNRKGDRRFHHAIGSKKDSIELLRKEYERLARHPLETLANKVRAFIQPEQGSTNIVICTINAQSLVAHVNDIETDTILMQSDIMVITETWMDGASSVRLNGYEIVSMSDSPTVGSEGSSNAQIRRTAGGVAIYRKISSPYSCRPVQANIPLSSMRDERTGEVSLGTVIMNGHDKLVIAAVYIHPGASRNNLEAFLLNALTDYSATNRGTSEGTNAMSALMITGDFNTNIDDNNWLIAFLSREFRLRYISSPHPTTLGNTTIDLTFVRDLNVSCLPYVSYFSYHRPLFNKITL